MTTQEILAQAHAEAQRRGVPVVQVLAQVVARIVELGLIPSSDVFHAQSLELAAKEPRQVCLGSKGRAHIERLRGCELTDDDVREIERTMEPKVTSVQVVPMRVSKDRDVAPSAKAVFRSDFALHVFDESTSQSPE